ncbi:MAG: hypothetical protein IPN76_19205 [Saprospiraceae bacterium]|nr:hypothetical protein [Saprospiraceae bacterium]
MKRYLFLLTMAVFAANDLQATIIYVNANIQGGNNNGSAWQHAFHDLKAALNAADYGDTLWVAKGTYLPTATNDRHISFNLRNGVRMFGGFWGNESQLSQRDWSANPTILSGDIGVQGDSTDNSYNVIFSITVDSTTVLDGFTITGGNADSQIPTEPVQGRTKSGGGAYLIGNSTVEDSRPVLLHCKFIGNYARQFGGAIFMRSNVSGSVTPIIKNCEFMANSALNGGGIYKQGSSFAHDMIMDSCTLSQNYAARGGGFSINNNYGNLGLTIFNCHFSRNDALSDGSCIFQENNNSFVANFSINNCLFSENSFGEIPGVSAVSILSNGASSEVRINGCSFFSNRAKGDGVVTVGYDNLNLDNSSFISNTTSQGTNCIFAISADLSINNCLLFDNTGEASDMGRFDQCKVLLTNSTIVNNISSRLNEYGEAGIFRTSGSPSSDFLIQNTILYGNIVPENKRLIYGTATINSSLVDVPDCDSLSFYYYGGYEYSDCGPGILFNTSPHFLDTAAHDYRLHPCSPARNAGSNAAAQAAGLLTDIAGLPRIMEDTVDMGAHETPAFAVGSATVTAPPCTVGALATVELALDWGCPPFFLSWAEAAGGSGTGFSDTSLALLQLPAGSYTVTVTDGRTAATTTSFTIAPPAPITAALDATAVQCATGTGPSTGGIATATPLGGAGPFTYAWSGGQASATATGLPPGTATVTITDANGCTATSSVLIGLVGGLQVGTSVLAPFFCHGEQDGVVQVQPLGGTPPFAYQWEGLSWEQSPVLDSVGPGSYSATVTDALGCTGDVQFSFGEPTAISVGVEVEQPACHGELGTATASATGGTPGFTYLWDTNAAGATATLPPGIHSVTATDANGCTGTTQLLVTEPPLLTAFVAAQPQTLCFDENNGQIAALPQGGTPPYAYDWGNGLPPDSLLTGIGAGPAGASTYALTLTDDNGCTATASATIAEHPEITAALDSIGNASGSGTADGGVAIASVSGGTGSGYIYLWNNGANTQDLVDVLPGDYTLTVTDPQGCTASFSFFVDVSLSANSARPNPFGAAIVPNPSGRGARARVQLSKAEDGLVCRVFDEAGRLVASGKAAGMTFELPQGLAAGSYRVLLQDGERRAVLIWVVE